MIEATAVGRPTQCPCGQVFTAPAAAAAPANTFVTACPSCGQQARVPEAARGRKAKCGKCGNIFTVPAAVSAVPQAVPMPAVPVMATNRVGPAANGGAVQAVPLQASPAAAPGSKRTLLWVALAGGGMAAIGLIVLLVVLLTRKSETTTDGQAGRTRKVLDTAYIAPEFCVALVVHPRRLLASPLLKDVPLKDLTPKEVKEAGLDVRKIEQVVVLYEPESGNQTRPDGGAIIRFSEDVNGKKMFTKLAKEVTEATFKGKKYYKASDDSDTGRGPVSCYVADARTLVIAPEQPLHKMMLAKEGKGPLVERLRDTDADQDVIAVLLMEPLREKAQELLKGVRTDDLPDEFKAIHKLPELLKAATASVNLSGDTLVRLDLEAKDNEASESVLKMAKEGVEQVKAFYKLLGRGIFAKMDKKLADPAKKLTDELITKVNIRDEAPRVVLEIGTPSDFAELSTKLAPQVGKLAKSQAGR
jgi:hypothetical protein